MQSNVLNDLVEAKRHQTEKIGLQVCMRVLPVRLALCDLEAPGWGALFPSCAFVASWLIDYCTVWHFWCCLFAVSPLPRQSLRWDKVIISWYVSDACELISWHRPCCFFVCFLGICVCLVLFLVFVLCLFVLHGDSSMDYVSILLSSLLYAHCRHDWCCH